MDQKTSMGDMTQALSSPEALRTEAVVCGAGAPAHTPQRPAQVYVAVNAIADGFDYLYVWGKGVWTAVK